MNIEDAARAAREASRHILSQSPELRVAALSAVFQSLKDKSEAIFQANAADLKRSKDANLAAPLLKRLKFDALKLKRVLEGIESLKRISDPIGRVLEKRELDDGLILTRVSGPIGVIGMIFESRPDALVQMATLCIRSGNAVILKGGSEARETNRILTDIIRQASIDAGLPDGWIQLAETREDVQSMLKLDTYIDLLIPRGSNAFVSLIMRESSIPVLGHADGLCHIYLDAAADVHKAVPIVLDSKMQYVAVCNAVETLLVHQDAASTILPAVVSNLIGAGCQLRGCERTREIIPMDNATEEDWSTEYLDAILSIRIVESMDAAIHHIHCYGSGHTDAIITEDVKAASHFLARVDSADVFHNCSTRFADGFVFGLGAEVGISTAKIHARGPVGVDGLLSYRWHLCGSGHIIADYSEGRKIFSHKDIIK